MSGIAHPTASARRAALGLAAAGLAALLIVLASSALAGAESAKQPRLDQTTVAGERYAREAYAKLPLAFVPNAGQTDARVRYSAQASGASFYFTQKAAVLAFAKERKGVALRLAFLGANPAATIEGRQRGPGRINYLLGSDPAKWHTGLPTYGEIVYGDLWPGIDLVFRGARGALKYEFVLRPGARVDDIRLAYRGTDGVSLDRSGNLMLPTALGTLTDSRPVSYQEIGGRQVRVASRFVFSDGGQYRFAVAGYDPRRPLVIDPGLLYSTYLGGSASDDGVAIAIDAVGNAYVTGQTTSTNFPTTPGVFDPTANGSSDAFVTKLNATGSALLYSTYLGGSGSELSFGFGGIAVDGAGSAYVTGYTNSTNFPTTPGAFDTSANGSDDAYVTKLDPAGSELLYSTYLGGSGADLGLGIAVDGTGSAHVAGQAGSASFPTTPGAFDTTPNGSVDVFVTKLNAAGSALAYSTYLGGSGADIGFGVAVDAADTAYVTGQTISANFPTTAGALDTTPNGSSEAFVTNLNATGSALLYSTYLGGGAFDLGFAVTADSAGSAYMTGQTASANFPTTPGAFDTTHNGGNDVFVTKLNATGTALLYSTYLGGSSADEGRGIAVDPAGSAYIAGHTISADFPTTPGAFDSTLGSANDAFVAKLNATGSTLAYSTYLGGSLGAENGFGIAADASGSAYVTGFTTSADFPTTPGSFDTSYNGSHDVFVTKLSTAAVPATLTLSPPTAVNTVGTSHTVTATVQDATGQPVEDVIVRFTVTGSVSASGQCTTDASGRCTFTYQGPPLPGADTISAYADSDGDSTQDAGEPTGAATKTWVLPPSTEFCEVKITNGGWFVASNGDRASFGGNAQVATDGSVKGEQEYRDHGPAQARNVHSIELTATTCSEDLTMATIFGTATVDGSGTFVFRIDVIDMGEPGTNDSYGIIMSDGYASGQHLLLGGNVQIHKS